MIKPETTDEGLFVMKYRNFIPMIVAIVMFTNLGSIFYQKQSHNTDNIKYNKERSDRISDRKLQEAKDHYTLEQLKLELKECKKK